MTISVLRTADAWWVKTPNGAARIDTAATTTADVTHDYCLRDRGALPHDLGALEVSLGPCATKPPPVSGAGAEARLETRGSLTTDYSLTVERVGPLSKRAGARIGGGGPEIRLNSLTGDLRLLERPPAPASR